MKCIMAVCPTHPGKYYMPFKCAFDGLLNQTKNGPLDYCSVMNCQTPDNLLDLSSFLFSFLFFSLLLFSFDFSVDFGWNEEKNILESS